MKKKNEQNENKKRMTEHNEQHTICKLPLDTLNIIVDFLPSSLIRRFAKSCTSFWRHYRLSSIIVPSNAYCDPKGTVPVALAELLQDGCYLHTQVRHVTISVPKGGYAYPLRMTKFRELERIQTLKVYATSSFGLYLGTQWVFPSLSSGTLQYIECGGGVDIFSKFTKQYSVATVKFVGPELSTPHAETIVCCQSVVGEELLHHGRFAKHIICESIVKINDLRDFCDTHQTQPQQIEFRSGIEIRISETNDTMNQWWSPILPLPDCIQTAKILKIQSKVYTLSCAFLQHWENLEELDFSEADIHTLVFEHAFPTLKRLNLGHPQNPPVLIPTEHRDVFFPSVSHVMADRVSLVTALRYHLPAMTNLRVNQCEYFTELEGLLCCDAFVELKRLHVAVWHEGDYGDEFLSMLHKIPQRSKLRRLYLMIEVEDFNGIAELNDQISFLKEDRQLMARFGEGLQGLVLESDCVGSDFDMFDSGF